MKTVPTSVCDLPDPAQPVSPEHHHTLEESSRLAKPLFESPEHISLGDAATLYFGTGKPEPAATTKLHVKEGLQLTYGQIMALSGDFFGDWKNPISDGATPEKQRQRFSDAFSTLPTRHSVSPYPYQAAGVLDVIASESKAIDKAIAAGLQPSQAAWPNNTLLYEYWTDLRYLLLAAWNWDHFGQRAVLAYQAGHGAALSQALAARKIDDPVERRRALELAYAMNAFADHFLSDLFSAGHLRTPRKELWQNVGGPSVGSQLAWWMHDEDSKWGLICQGPEGQSWKAYGDKRLFDSVNLKNQNIAETAVQFSIDEIYLTFKHGTLPEPGEYLALQIIADLAAVQKPDNKFHHSPMFVWNGEKLLRRTNLNDLNDYSWTDNWWGTTTLAWLKAYYNPLPPTAYIAPPIERPSFDPKGWQSTTPVPPNWVAGKRVRYTVSFFRDLEESDFGPWSQSEILKDQFFPTLVDLPVDTSGKAKGRRIWRQFDDKLFELVGEISDNSTKTFIDKKP